MSPSLKTATLLPDPSAYLSNVAAQAEGRFNASPFWAGLRARTRESAQLRAAPMFARPLETKEHRDPPRDLVYVVPARIASTTGPEPPNTVGGSPYVEGVRREVAKYAPQLAFRRGHTLARASSFRQAEHLASTSE